MIKNSVGDVIEDIVQSLLGYCGNVELLSCFESNAMLRVTLLKSLTPNLAERCGVAEASEGLEAALGKGECRRWQRHRKGRSGRRMKTRVAAIRVAAMHERAALFFKRASGLPRVWGTG